MGRCYSSSVLFAVVVSLSFRFVNAQTHCCASNFASCSGDEWCDESADNCSYCDAEWIPVAGRDNCIPRWESCTHIPDDSDYNPCCGAARCIRHNQWWKGCEVPRHCCSWDFKNCGDSEWCNISSENCAECGESSWVNQMETASCLARWETCGASGPGCCPGTVCVTHENGWQGCNLPEMGVAISTSTSFPTPPPTPPPTPLPSDSPVASNSYCCSWDLANCGTDIWCNEAKDHCVDWCSGYWINPAETTDCDPRWSGCDRTSDNCCGESSCTFQIGGWWECAVPDLTATTDVPVWVPVDTSAPVSAPVDTGAPVPIPTDTNLPVDGLIDPASSSERVTIPYPSEPASLSRSDCPHDSQDLIDWHDGLGDELDGQDVNLPENSKIVIRQSVSGTLGIVTIPASSELIIGESPGGISLDARGIDVMGALRVGSETCRIESPVTISLHGSRPDDAVTNPREPTYKGISVTGTLSLHGKRYFSTWTRLAKTVQPGDTSIHLQHKVNWEPDQEIILVTTAMKDSREEHENEVLQIDAVDTSPSIGTIVYLKTPAQYKHVGIQAYQAEVGLLTRTVTIQGSGDSEPSDEDPLNCSGERWMYGNYRRPCANTELTGFGGHIMVHSGGKGYVEGIELVRMGQTNVLGRYPMHFHLLGDCPDCYFTDSSVHHSYYRCISIHGTNSVTVSENVAFDVIGYCYYLEDGIERNNTISFNLGAHIHLLGPEAPWGYGQTTDTYQQSDILTLPADVTASAFYITNVDNDIIGNAASGGWSGFAFPNLPTPLGPNRFINMRPSSVLGGTIDGNTAHSTAWWWEHAGAFYFGGALYYDGDTLEYNPGRSFNFADHNRNTCLEDLCAAGNCAGWCGLENQAFLQITNSKAFLAAGVGMNSWSGRMEVLGFETHDVGLALEALESGFWIDNMLAQCRTGEPISMPSGASAAYVRGDGFFWYDTDQDHIISDSTFRNCGTRSSEFQQYDASPTRGCGDDPQTGCRGSTVFGFLTHSDQFNPEIMQGTKGIEFEDCGRRFYLSNFLGDDAPSTVSGRIQNWYDADGSVTGFGMPSIIGSGLADAGLWWHVDQEVIHDPQGPLKFIKVQRQRGLGHVRLYFDDSQHDQVGDELCGNGSQAPCPPLGYIKHRGRMFENDNGLPVTARADITGPVGGFGWMLKLNQGSPKTLRMELIEIRPDTPMMLSIAYPETTSFVITMYAAWCTANDQYSCQEQYSQVPSLDEVRNSDGNTYHFENGILTLRIIQPPANFVGNPDWFLPTYEDIDAWGQGYALPRFERAGILLPKMSYGPYLEIEASCQASGAYCDDQPPAVDSDICPSGYDQVAYDACCSNSDPSQCVYP